MGRGYARRKRDGGRIKLINFSGLKAGDRGSAESGACVLHFFLFVKSGRKLMKVPPLSPAGCSPKGDFISSAGHSREELGLMVLRARPSWSGPA
ncbi:hypothetical protein RRG08_014104 [Elysia crispata]|uniref:Uncharacterized protein n=1 Tax=Elysia crispata TaxID=231223 RepID=A0AAE0XQR5_9GAST|nr:hypothetical protein RRG08_014104 [Elysia crispata]